MAKAQLVKKSSVSSSEYENYLDERSLLIDAEREGARAFDKYILTLAAGAFGLSLTFMKQIAPTILAETKILLLIAWAFFGASILATLISFLTSQKACRKQLAILENDADPAARNWYARLTAWLNVTSIIAFICGTIALASFSSANLMTVKEVGMKQEKQAQQKQATGINLPRPSKSDKEAGYVPPRSPKKPASTGKN